MSEPTEPVPLKVALKTFCENRWRKAQQDVKRGTDPQQASPWSYIGKTDTDLMHAAIACKVWAP